MVYMGGGGDPLRVPVVRLQEGFQFHPSLQIALEAGGPWDTGQYLGMVQVFHLWQKTVCKGQRGTVCVSQCHQLNSQGSVVESLLRLYQRFLTLTVPCLPMILRPTAH